VSDLLGISCGELHACAVASTGKVYCWGENSHGELGNGGTSGSIPTPSQLVTIDSVFSMAAGRRSTCALKKNGDVFCWGANDLGQLGSGSASSAPNPTPTQVPGLKASALWAGDDHACAVKSGGVGIVCWGSGYYGQLGDNVVRDDASTPQATPVSVNGVNRMAIGIGTGGNHSCAPLETGAILCWGANDHGQIGNGTTDPALTPDSVMGYP
jgi:alpha-tubulin suppressor-like RCC1 family protein